MLDSSSSCHIFLFSPLQVFKTLKLISLGPLFIGHAVRDFGIVDPTYTNFVIVEDSLLQSFIHHHAGRSWQLIDGRFLNKMADDAGRNIPLLFAAIGGIFVFCMMIYLRGIR
jgi:hypothetical protein